MRPLLLLLAPLACGAPAPASDTPRVATSALVADPAPLPAYDDVLVGLEGRRTELAARFAEAPADERAAIRQEASRVVLDTLTERILPHWFGTPWDFYGTTQTPGEGAIACGYLVSTVLEHAGFRVERVRMAQQASEYILLSLVAPDRVRRFRDRPVEEVVEHVSAAGEGLWLVGLDYHVGFLWNDGELVRFCHSSYLDPGGVVCEPALSSAAMVSRYRVVGPLLDDPMIDAWLEQRAIPTVTR